MTDAQREALDQQRRKLAEVADETQAHFASAHEAREQALRLSREVVRNSANSIRATHRGEFAQARSMVEAVSGLAQEMRALLERHPAIYYAGFVEDALKEFVEAHATLAFAEGSELQGPDALQVGYATYVNGLAEAVGELRRFILDSLRKDDFSRCEELLDLMDEVYTILVSMDYPDAITRGLRRNTDMVRGVLERTRGDLTVALRQRRLEQRLDRVQGIAEGDEISS